VHGLVFVFVVTSLQHPYTINNNTTTPHQQRLVHLLALTAHTRPHQPKRSTHPNNNNYSPWRQPFARRGYQRLQRSLYVILLSMHACSCIIIFVIVASPPPAHSSSSAYTRRQSSFFPVILFCTHTTHTLWTQPYDDSRTPDRWRGLSFKKKKPRSVVCILLFWVVCVCMCVCVCICVVHTAKDQACVVVFFNSYRIVLCNSLM
jgi:hypothetical protein